MADLAMITAGGDRGERWLEFPAKAMAQTSELSIELVMFDNNFEMPS